MQCTSCSWDGVTARGRLRWAVFGLGLAVALGLGVIELVAGSLGDDLLPWVICVLLISLAVRLLIRADRCPRCGARAIYVKRAERG